MAERPYVSLLRALGAAQIEFAIAGGFAVVLRGVMTLATGRAKDRADAELLGEGDD